MAYALVGSVGAVVQSATGSTISTLAWGSGESRTANNLLILWVTGKGAATLPTAPSGWSTVIQQAGTSCSSSIFYKIAAGSDSAPSVTGVASTNLSAQLAEFSGGVSSSPVDQTGGAAGTTSTLVATAGGTDAALGELVVYASVQTYSAGAVSSNSMALNNGATAQDTNNNGGSSANHYVLGYGITTGNSGADTATLTYTTTNITGAVTALASFKLPAAAGPLPGSFFF